MITLKMESISHDRACLFGAIHNNKMHLNEMGEIVHNEFKKTSEIRKNIEIDCFVVMPNHIHGIVIINHVGAYGIRPNHIFTNHIHTPPIKLHKNFKSPSNNLGSMVRGYKSAVTRQINKYQNTTDVRIWQRNYHEHIIRNKQSYYHIREYIFQNPKRWKEDVFFTDP